MHLKIKPERNRNSGREAIHAVRSAVEAGQYIVSLRSAGFVSEPWQTRARYPVLEKQAGNRLDNLILR